LRRLTFVRVVVALAILWCPRVASPQSASSNGMAPLWTVHIDEVLPGKEEEFERLNIAENQGVHKILRNYGQPSKPVYEIVTTGAVYLSMRPKPSFTDFDAPSTIPDSVSRLFSTVTDTLDTPIHAALKFHHNEIWRYHKTDSYIPATPGYVLTTPGYIQLFSERVIPGKEERYGELVDSLNAALKRSNYPLCVLMFTSSYGDGAYKYFWQADSREAFLKAGDRAAVLTAVFGKRVAQQMLVDLKSCLHSSEIVDARARRDFAESEAWLGMPSR